VTSSAPPKLHLPATPRPVTRAVNRRSWRELRVQAWWKSAVVVGLITAVVTAGYIREAAKRHRLLATGIMLDGILNRVEGVSARENPNWKVMRDHSVPVEVGVVLPDGRLATLEGTLPAAQGFLAVNGKIKVRVEPDDISNWGESVQLLQWWEVVAVPLLFMVPVVLIALAIAEVQRRRVIAVWRNGIRAEGVVVDVKQIAMAPRSRLVRFTLVDGPDRRIITSLYPPGSTPPAPGDALNLIYPIDRPQHAIVADLYVRPGDQVAAPPQPSAMNVALKDQPQDQLKDQPAE
jgi:hypothetical protein